MKPHLICRMVSSVDGRTLPKRWRPEGFDATPTYERLHDEWDGTNERPPVTAISLMSSEALEGGAVWLRYRIGAGAAA